ncbi:DUF4971 domain-containing protein [Bacteroides thetaiotaomicron]|uniref:DUF4971 domain-containing protein n=1 Tax=Bacteroides thetaiotaomicron TaxID=818 RepID=UPI001F211C66|nr:DUF4971 domain-containing protein [Bacteroides thetaiotaomicron]MCE8488724.1 DUF4971 domain-containing protein [Bacteroides thetaiotaomicron]
MKKIHYLILLCFTALCFIACNDDEPEFSGIEGKDRFISDFVLTVAGTTYQGMIAGDTITIEIPYNTSLKGATAAYTLSEGASINPDPSTIQNWANEWKFVVTSKMQESKVYSYTYRYTDIGQSGSIVLATQAEVDNFAKTGINKIDGNLTIGTADGEEITNLEGLANLKQISNALVINPSYKGADLSGLDNLEHLGSFKLGSTLSTSKNTTLKTVGLPSLLGVVGDFVINSSVVEKVSIPKVGSIGEEMYIVSDALRDLDANAVELVGSSLILKGTTDVGEKITGKAMTEAIVFSSLKQVGNGLAFQYFPKLQGIYLPALENAGTVSFTNLELIGSIAITELRSVGDFTIDDCNNLSTVSLPVLATSGKLYIEAQVNNLNITSLKSVNGEMYLGAVNIKELDVSSIDFNGNTLSLYACDFLHKITGPETFNGSFYFNWSKTEEFTIEGISDLQGSFYCYGYNKLQNFVMPFSTIKGYATVNLSSGECNIEAILFPELQEVGGELTFDKNYNVGKIEFPLLKRVAGTVVVNSNQITNGVLFSELESIGSNTADATTEFKILAGDIVCPKLKTISGSLKITTGNSTVSESISYPNLETISDNLEMTSTSINRKTRTIDLPTLKSIKQIEIKNWTMVKDFSTFKYLFENNILTEASQWTVTKCGYNPTFQDMKEGRYTPAE